MTMNSKNGNVMVTLLNLVSFLIKKCKCECYECVLQYFKSKFL